MVVMMAVMWRLSSVRTVARPGLSVCRQTSSTGVIPRRHVEHDVAREHIRLAKSHDWQRQHVQSGPGGESHQVAITDRCWRIGCPDAVVGVTCHKVRWIDEQVIGAVIGNGHEYRHALDRRQDAGGIVEWPSGGGQW